MARLGVSGAVIGGEYIAGDLSITNGVIDQVGLPPGRGGLAIPGFVDLQVNGFAGVNFATATVDQWREASRRLAQTGVSEYVANIISSDDAVVAQALSVATDAQRSAEPTGARLAGVHLEGPFLSAPKAGIHPLEHLRNPDGDLLWRWLAAGPVAMVTVAPELPGALELISHLRTHGVVVSLGHSQASYQQAIAGFDHGATTVTHLFNAMSGISAREPGLAGAALSRSDVWLQLIVDLLHVDKALVELVIQFAAKRIVAVSDCLPMTGEAVSSMEFGGSAIHLTDGRAVNDQGVLAGSVLHMHDALRHAVGCGMSVVDAVNATSKNPLSVLHRATDTLLSPGCRADVVVVSDGLDVERVVLSGVDVHVQEGV